MTRIVKMLSTVVVGAVLAGAPLLAQETKIDYNHSFPFNKVKTYSYAKVQAADPLVEPRITIAIDRVLQGMNMHLVSKNPDVLVSAVQSSNDQALYTDFYGKLPNLKWTRSWGGGGFSDSYTTLTQIPNGTLVVDMYLPSTGELVWRGTATQPATSKERKAGDSVDKSVNTLFTKFPPKLGGAVAPNQIPAADSQSSSPTSGTN